VAKDKDERPPADYEVGYRKPPAKTRFKPGVSGNPHGRPKGASNFSTILDQELGIKRSVWGTKKLAEKLAPGSSVWGGVANEPKTKRSRASIPVVKQLAEALEAHKLRMGILAQPNLPIFQCGNGQPLNLDNLVRRVIVPALSRCAVCRKQEEEHKPEGHVYQRDKTLPQWHGWHAFRRGLATNLHGAGVDDKTIQGILRHSNIGITQNIYIKSVSESQVSAMDTLSEKLGICNDHATSKDGPIN